MSFNSNQFLNWTDDKHCSYICYLAYYRVTVLGVHIFLHRAAASLDLCCGESTEAKHKCALLLNAFLWSIYLILCRFSEDSNCAGFVFFLNEAFTAPFQQCSRWRESSLTGQESGSSGVESLLSSVILHAEWDSASRSYWDNSSGQLFMALGHFFWLWEHSLGKLKLHLPHLR